MDENKTCKLQVTKNEHDKNLTTLHKKCKMKKIFCKNSCSAVLKKFRGEFKYSTPSPTIGCPSVISL